MAKKPTIDIENAKSWLHDIFVAGGLGTQPKRAIDKAQYEYMYGDQFYGDELTLRANAKIIVEALQFRKSKVEDFNRYDEALDKLSTFRFAPSLKETTTRGIIKNAATLAKYIAWFCTEYEYWWDDSNASTYEKDQIKESTLGEILFGHECFMSQNNTTTPASSTKSRSKNSNTGSNTRISKGTSAYKTSGGQSGQARALVGQPGVKENISGSAYWIKGIKTGSTKDQCAFVRPLVVSGDAGGVNTVFFGDASGNKDCRVFFDDQAEAENFLAKCEANGKIGSSIDNVKVVSVKADSNGYFKVDTEFGNVFIKASKLNEEIQEELESEAPKKPHKKLSSKEKWERYEEAYFHEM